MNEIGTNATWDSGELLVVEADESDGTFLQLAPEIGIVTSVEPDHLEHYGSFEALKGAFATFLGQVGSAVVCADDPVAASSGAAVGGQLRVLAVGAGCGSWALRAGATACASAPANGGEQLGDFELPVPGLHNARNAAACVAACLELGIDPELRQAGAGALRRGREAL